MGNEGVASMALWRAVIAWAIEDACGYGHGLGARTGLGSCPPTAEVTGSKPFGCAKFFHD